MLRSDQGAHSGCLAVQARPSASVVEFFRIALTAEADLLIRCPISMRKYFVQHSS